MAARCIRITGINIGNAILYCSLFFSILASNYHQKQEFLFIPIVIIFFCESILLNIYFADYRFRVVPVFHPYRDGREGCRA